MQIGTWLNLAVVILVALSGVLFLIGYKVGRSGGKWFGIVITIVIVTLLLMGPGSYLAYRNGVLIGGEFLLLTVAMDLALVCGYFVGLRAAIRSWHDLNARTGVALPAVLLLFLITDLIGFYLINNRVLEIVKEFGIIKDTAQIQKAPETPAVQDSVDNLKHLYHALAQYADSNEGRLPPAENWMDNEDLKGYIQKDEWLHDPAVSNGQDDRFGYAYNDTVAGRKLKEIPDAAKTPLLYESSNTAKSAHDAVSSLPRPGRRNGKNAILYCDGHVESVETK